MNPRVLIGVVTAEYARRADFYDHLNAIQTPPDSRMMFAHGQSPARNRNLIIEKAIENDHTHVFFMDDDIIVPRDGLIKLLSHDKDIVSGLYLMRNYPHQPLIFKIFDEHGRCAFDELSGRTGLIETVASGLGCLLIKTEVFKAMEKPWIRMGELESDAWCDDIGFYGRVRPLGIKSYCDLDVECGHIASVVIYPKGNNIVYDTAGPNRVEIARQ